MKTLHQIREDLRAIRFYYEKKSDLERGAKHIGESAVVQLVEKYNAAVRNAPLRLYDLYVCLYVNNNTQAVVAEDKECSTEYIRRLHKQLCEYLQQAVGKEESESA